MTARMSVSLLFVSSKPGVSKRVTRRPSMLNGWETWTWSVHDSRPSPTRRLDPLAKLMNYTYTQFGRHRYEADVVLTDDFPTPVGPITL